MELLLTIEPTGIDQQWSITAELLYPTTTVLATVADLSFRLEGTEISNWSYNPSFDSDFFGPASRNNVSDSHIEFTGMNALPPLNNPGGTDHSNPLLIGTFDATAVDSFVLDGFTQGALWDFWHTRLTYLQSNGQPGDTPYSVVIVPAPAAFSLLGFAGIVSLRRRR